MYRITLAVLILGILLGHAHAVEIRYDCYCVNYTVRCEQSIKATKADKKTIVVRLHDVSEDCTSLGDLTLEIPVTFDMGAIGGEN